MSIYESKNLVSAFRVGEEEMNRLIALREQTNLPVPAVARLLLHRALRMPPPSAAELAMEHVQVLRAFKDERAAEEEQEDPEAKP